MADKAKLTEEELKSIQTAVSNLNQAKTILGDATNQAHKAQLQVNSMEEAMATSQKELEGTYGFYHLQRFYLCNYDLRTN